jgi:predicted Zn finger-like uncharacterized protein
MLTRCPHCETAFRVTPEQLKARNGLARCGSCHGVFNALDSLTDEVALVIGQQLRTEAMPFAAVEPQSETATGFAAEMTVETEALLPDDAQVVVAGEMPEPEPPSEAEIESAAVALPLVEAGTEAVSPVADIDFALPSEEAAADNNSESRLPQDGAAMVEADLNPDAEPDTQNVLPAAPEAAPVAAPEPEEAAFPEAWSAVAAPPPPPRRWPWITGVFLLLVLMVGQMLFVFRIELGVLLPELRPALVAGCDLLGCVLAHPRKPEMLSIETSDLAPSDGDHLLFTATLKNRAPFDQEYPHLELTLTDTRDAAMVRKVLAPADYLSPSQSIKAGFSARSDLAVKLTLEALGVPAVGYRLYLFYP